MEYARFENEKIIMYSKLPNKYVGGGINVVGGFDKLSDEIHREQGFYPLIKPEYDCETHHLGALYFDEYYEVFTYNLIAFTPFEIIMQDWAHPEFSIRITASSGLIDLYPSIAIWMQLNNLPIELSEDTTIASLYMNEIKPQHQELFDLLIQAGEIQLENIPQYQ